MTMYHPVVPCRADVVDIYFDKPQDSLVVIILVQCN